MCSRQGEVRHVVIEVAVQIRRYPRIFTVARGAVGTEPGILVVRICRLVVIILVAARTRIRRIRIAIRMAARALVRDCGMCSA